MPRSVPKIQRSAAAGYEPWNVGWHEADQLARVLDAVEDKRDVEDLVDALLDDDSD